MPRKKKAEAVEAVVEQPEEVVVDFPNNGVEVVTHFDRWDSGTNTNVSGWLPSLDD